MVSNKEVQRKEYLIKGIFRDQYKVSSIKSIWSLMLIIIAKMDIFIKKSKFCHHLPTLMSTTLTLQKVQKEIVKIIHMWF